MRERVKSESRSPARITVTNLQYLRFDLLKEVDELDVCGQQKLSGWHRAMVELGVQKFKLRQRTARTDHKAIYKRSEGENQ